MSIAAVASIKKETAIVTGEPERSEGDRIAVLRGLVSSLVPLKFGALVPLHYGVLALRVTGASEVATFFDTLQGGTGTFHFAGYVVQ